MAGVLDFEILHRYPRSYSRAVHRSGTRVCPTNPLVRRPYIQECLTNITTTSMSL